MNGKLTLWGARVSLVLFSHRSRIEKLRRADGFLTGAKKEKAMAPAHRPAPQQNKRWDASSRLLRIRSSETRAVRGLRR
jgi:hypothetical protein